MRALENVGLPQQVEDASIGYLESKHPDYLIHSDNNNNKDSNNNNNNNKPVTAHQMIVCFLCNALRFATKNRPFLEEIGLPTLETKKPESDKEKANKKGDTSNDANTDVAFVVQPTAATFAHIADILDQLSAAYLSKKENDPVFQVIITS